MTVDFSFEQLKTDVEAASPCHDVYLYYMDGDMVIDGTVNLEGLRMIVAWMEAQAK